MSSYPLQTTLDPSISNTTNTAREPNVSLDIGLKQPTLPTDRQETSTNEIQSFVIVKDINVEEELKKARKDDKNYFKVLSMSFYGKGKSRSVDSQEFKEKCQISVPNGDVQEGLMSKLSSHTPSDTKRSAFHKQNNKSMGSLKKSGTIVKEFYMIPEQFRKRFLSPREDLRKLCSPMALGNNNKKEEGNSKLRSDKELSSCVSSQQRSNTLKNRDMSAEKEENKISVASYLKMISVGRSSSPKNKSPKKKSVSKAPKKSFNMISETEERLNTFNIVPSLLEVELQKVQEASKKKSRNPSPEVSSKQTLKVQTKKHVTQQDSVVSLKPAKNKSISTPTKSTKSLPSTANSQLKISRSESQEVKKPMEIDLKTITGSNYGEKLVTQGGEPRNKNEKDPIKAQSQDLKGILNTEERPKHLSLFDLQDSDNEDGVIRLDSLPMNLSKVKKKKKVSAEKIERQRSPFGLKLNEKVPMGLGNGMGNWEMKNVVIPKDDITLKLKRKETSQESISPDYKHKSKPNSVEKISRVDITDVYEEMRSDERNKKKNQYTPKLDIFKMKDDRAMKLFEVYGQPKEKKDKSRPMSPAIGEFHKAFNLFGKLASRNRKEKL